jgi:UDP-N-acetylmuramoylalanine--D-glutamate ligase
MIAAKSFSGKRVAVMGLARSGQSAVAALKAGGAEVIAWDDNDTKCKETEPLGAHIKDLTEEDFTEIDALVLSPGIPHSYPKPHLVVEQAKKSKHTCNRRYRNICY